MLATIFTIAAFVLFMLAALGVPCPTRFNLIAAGLACWVAAQFVFGPLLR